MCKHTSFYLCYIHLQHSKSPICATASFTYRHELGSSRFKALVPTPHKTLRRIKWKQFYGVNYFRWCVHKLRHYTVNIGGIRITEWMNFHFPRETQFKLSGERNTTHIHIILVLPSTGMQRNQCNRVLRYSTNFWELYWHFFSRYKVCDKVINI